MGETERMHACMCACNHVIVHVQQIAGSSNCPVNNVHTGCFVIVLQFRVYSEFTYPFMHATCMLFACMMSAFAYV